MANYGNLHLYQESLGGSLGQGMANYGYHQIHGMFEFYLACSIEYMEGTLACFFEVSSYPFINRCDTLKKRKEKWVWINITLFRVFPYALDFLTRYLHRIHTCNDFAWFPFSIFHFLIFRLIGMNPRSRFIMETLTRQRQHGPDRKNEP